MQYHMYTFMLIVWMAQGINDFCVGVQLCDGNAGENIGNAVYTPYLSEGGGWSVWAGDSNFFDPDGLSISLIGRQNDAFKESEEFILRDIDIRLCIQLTDYALDERGNQEFEGDSQCTPWSSEEGGWSEWAGDSNFYDFDAVRVALEIREFDGLIVSDIQAGVRLSDERSTADTMGEPKFTDWLIASQGETWSEWAGDSNFYDADSIKIYLGVQINIDFFPE